LQLPGTLQVALGDAEEVVVRSVVVSVLVKVVVRVVLDVITVTIVDVVTEPRP
jgi:hypothetical protein